MLGVRVGDAGGVLAFGFGEGGGEVSEFLLEGGAGHIESYRVAEAA